MDLLLDDRNLFIVLVPKTLILVSEIFNLFGSTALAYTV